MKKRDNGLTPSLEDYLEAIFNIVAEKGVARVKEIAGRLNVKNPSVTGALHGLAERGLVNYAPYELISLTEDGKTVAKDIDRRHKVLRDFFTDVLRVDEVEADRAACKMEHAVPRVIVERLVDYAQFLKSASSAGSETAPAVLTVNEVVEDG